MDPKIKKLRAKFEGKYGNEYTDLFEELASNMEDASYANGNANEIISENSVDMCIIPTKSKCPDSKTNIYELQLLSAKEDSKVVPKNTKMKASGKCNIMTPLHTFILDILRRIYQFENHSLRNKFDKELKDEMLNMMASIHCNNETILIDCITKNINTGDSMQKVNSTMVFHEVKNILPENPLISGSGAWLFDKPLVNAITIICFFLMIINEGLDIKLTYDYFDWEYFLRNYDSGFNETMPAQSMTNHGFDFVPCNTFSCKIHGLHPRLAFWYSLFILLMVHIIELMSPITTMKVHERVKYDGGGHMGSMIAFYMGYCCREKIKQVMERKIRGRSSMVRLLFKMKYLFVLFICGLFLPVSTKLFCIIQEIRVFNICSTLNKELSHTVMNKGCERCYDCTNLKCLCISCGYKKSCIKNDDKKNETEKTNKAEKEYDECLKHIIDNSIRLESTSRIIVACIQDTFLSVIQLYLAIPQIIQYHEYTKKQENGIEVAKTYTMLVVSTASVISSIFSIANIMTKSFFGLTVNPYLGTIKFARLTIFISMTFQVASRLIFLQMFGLTFFEDPLYVPLWMALMVSGHIVIVFTIIFLLQAQTVYHKLRGIRNKKQNLSGYIIGTFLTATASLYKSMNIGTQRLNKHINNSELENEQIKSQQTHEKDRIQWRRTKNSMKMIEDMVINTFIISEQVVMFVFAYNSRYDDGIVRGILFGALVLFILGKTGEILFHCFFVIPAVDRDEDIKHWCNLQQKFIRYKNKIGLSIAFMMLSAIIGIIFYLFHATIWPLGALCLMLSPFIALIYCPGTYL